MSNGKHEHGVALVSEVGQYGCLAEARGTFDSCLMEQDAALAEVEQQLVEALADVRALRAKLQNEKSG